ncbi:hypothetical protein [Alysiella crassa]|uniref:Uncharacterized protein n=1 Tax=Alysiella crassa TaxID=153491 RepID=A0A376BUE1_9NEIS|nr:hypothetical protein [Alysiella crassa]UOP06149.1 hypothetical protein LVJ80_09975 [Alysiella crassa]SSY80622.1 Uncharacterised protein [Alysiella crassa]
MITQSIHFEVSGQDAQRLLAACQARNIAPVQAFELFCKVAAAFALICASFCTAHCKNLQ